MRRIIIRIVTVVLITLGAQAPSWDFPEFRRAVRQLGYLYFGGGHCHKDIISKGSASSVLYFPPGDFKCRKVFAGSTAGLMASIWGFTNYLFWFGGFLIIVQVKYT